MKKKYKIIFIILLVNIVAVGIWVLFNSFKEQGYATVILDDFGRWVYSNEKWSKIPSYDLEDYSWKKYDIYVNHEFLGNYYLMYSSKKWNIFDNDKKAIRWKIGTIALGGSMKSRLEDISVDVIDSDEYSYAKEVLNSFNIRNQDISKIGFKNKYVFDLDKDGKKDYIYAISNAQMQGNYVQNKTYTVVFLRKDNKNIILYKLIENKNNNFSGCVPEINAITLGRNKIPKVILNCVFYSASTINSSIYDYDIKKKEFNIVFRDVKS